MRAALLAMTLVAALLSGCLVEDDHPTDAIDTPGPSAGSDQQDPAASEPAPAQADQDAAAGDATYAPHGEPQRTDGPVTTGMDPQRVPGAWARQTITITNGAGDATLAQALLSVAAGTIRVTGADTDHYTLAADLESRALSEDAAREALARVHLNHDDQLADRVLHLVSNVTIDPPVQAAPLPPPVPEIHLGLTDVDLRVSLVLTVPATLAMGLGSSTASADVVVEGLHGPSLDVASSSGDITLRGIDTAALRVASSSGDIVGKDLTVGRLDASSSSGDLTFTDVLAAAIGLTSSSGDIVVKGTVDDLDAGSSSGDITADVEPSGSGKYDLGSSSGDIVLRLAAGHYHVDAGTSSGDIVIDLPDSKTLEDEERHVEAVSKGYGDAKVQTEVDIGTSSGDITVRADE